MSDDTKWTEVRKKCNLCGRGLTLSHLDRNCGAYICDNAACNDNHAGMARCYCGWTASGTGDGRSELEELGETIEEDA